jgi:hypothetical protein
MGLRDGQHVVGVRHHQIAGRDHAIFSLMSDPLPYGMAASRHSIDALVTYALQQKLIPSRPQFDQVFVDIDP